MTEKCFSCISASICLLTLLPLALAAIHWFQGPLEILLNVHLYLPSLLSVLGVGAAIIGIKGDLKLNLVLFNVLSLSLYVILTINLNAL
ncbi:hypothetical protein B481_0485 [Planococcus halocryophilus Or1]|uniref:Uncharacterized protein n=1 Tax=Planococcus halocryophilus TaxID=1215089 RepID=A0A1C7DNT9_9BACL|nr:hypothetical protein [Planococcus halocryophilus]ANU13135.1 hypothetical protein BBI08_04445 [Planococcus halocryophilus]EMF47942.1 hypothetical protein B481_0485 [Planococcus halocryophilus Or1]